MVQQSATLGESQASVLQELLLALLGCPGDIYIKQPRTQGLKSSHLAEPRECDLRLAEDLDWISPPDRWKTPFSSCRYLDWLPSVPFQPEVHPEC